MIEKERIQRAEDSLVAYRNRIDNFLVSYLSAKVTNWWGELTLEDYIRLDDGDGFIIELEDKRRSQCRLTKRVNRAVSGIPPRWIYHITGTSPLE